MKKLLSFLILIAIPASTFAYTLTDNDKTVANRAIQKIEKINRVNQDKIL